MDFLFVILYDMLKVSSKLDPNIFALSHKLLFLNFILATRIFNINLYDHLRYKTPDLLKVSILYIQIKKNYFIA